MWEDESSSFCPDLVSLFNFATPVIHSFVTFVILLLSHLTVRLGQGWLSLDHKHVVWTRIMR